MLLIQSRVGSLTTSELVALHGRITVATLEVYLATVKAKTSVFVQIPHVGVKHS